MSANPTSRRRGPGRRRGRPTVFVPVVLVPVVLVGAVSVPLFLAPAADPVDEVVAAGGVDAVMVLGGGSGERLEIATSLVRAQLAAGGPAPTVVIATSYEAPVQTCGQLPGLPDVPLECFRPAPFTTSGEALELGRRAAAAGWDRVAVASSDYHLTRTRVLAQRCLDELSPGTQGAWLAGQPDLSVLRHAWVVALEWVSLAGTPLDHECG